MLDHSVTSTTWNLGFEVQVCKDTIAQNAIDAATFGICTLFDGNSVDCIDGGGVILPTTAAINKKNDRLLKKIADVTTKRASIGRCAPDYLRTSQPHRQRTHEVPR
jgi:hypothetical protein